MTKYTLLTLGGLQVRVETETSEGHHDSGPSEKSGIDLEEQLYPLLETARYMMQQMRQMGPQEVELSFGIKVNGERNFLAIARNGAEAQFNIKMAWKDPGGPAAAPGPATNEI